MGTLPHRPGCPWSILLPPTGRWLWGQPVSEDGIFVQCPLVTCWLFDLDLGLSNFKFPHGKDGKVTTAQVYHEKKLR